MSTRDYLVIDLEATCDDGGLVPKHEMEIIEIGAVRVDATSLRPVAEFQTFVRPVRNPALTPFCRTLTSIEQAQVDRAPTFPVALAALRAFLTCGQGPPPLFCSWGAYDKNQFERDARHHGVALPFGEDHLNVKMAFSRALGTTRRFGMAEALRTAGLPLDGTHHRGIDDARNISKLLGFIRGGSRPGEDSPRACGANRCA